MEYIIIVLVCFLSSVVGAVCGIGGGVIIKPVLDATGILAVTTGSFLSGCTVLSMSVVSLYKNMRMKHDFVFDKAFATVIAAGGVAAKTSEDVEKYLSLNTMASIPLRDSADKQKGDKKKDE